MELKVQPYSPDMLEDWLSFMREVQSESSAWEAAYLEHPDFSHEVDHIYLLSGELVGYIGGRRAVGASGPKFMIEILAVHPDRQERGYGRRMIEDLKTRLPQGTCLSLWTRDDRARAIYRHWGFASAGRYRRHCHRTGAGHNLFEIVADSGGELEEFERSV